MEYEYSFEVKSLDKYINYCKDNKYEQISSNHQIRTIYRNYPNIARITINKEDTNTSYYLDFKEDKIGNSDLNIRHESKEIQFDNLNNCEDILTFLGYKKDNTLERYRIVYKKNNVKFELDKYFLPVEKYVVSIEGVKSAVDKIYNEIK